MTVTSARGRRALRWKRRFKVRRLRGMAAAAALAAGFGLMTAGALTGAAVPFTAAAFLSYATDLYLHRTDPALMRLLGQRRAGVTVRVTARLALLVPLLIAVPYASADQCRAAVLGALSLATGIALFTALTAAVRRRRRLPFATRNIDLARLKVSRTPSRWLTGWPGQRLLHHEAVIWLGLAGTVATRRFAWVALAMAASGGAMAVALVLLAVTLRRTRRGTRAEHSLHKVSAWIGRYRPSVVLYFSGSRDSAYQLDMWLEPLAALPDARPLVLLRERHLLARLKPTALPVLCVPAAVDLMGLDLSPVRVALYPANVGKNIHLLREPGIKHVFIGHGDSDKAASVNPFSKVYDEVWVGGPAGRERYATAGVGVAPEAIVDVGRPQLDPVWAAEPPQPGARRTLTVLYAPTWEGWTDEPGNTSLTDAGENIVRELLALSPRVRIIYRPHPFTGIRCPRTRTAHQRIIHALHTANGRPGQAAAPQDGRRAGRQQRARRRRLEEARAARTEAAARIRLPFLDEAERSLVRARPDHDALARLEELDAECERLFWAAHPPTEHVVVEPGDVSLYGCFEQTDLLVSDISSVVSDFVATLKPYAITDTAGLGTAEFRARNTAARAGYVLAPDARGLAGVVDVVRFPALDALAGARGELRAHLLGPAQPPSAVRFAAAVARLTQLAAPRHPSLRATTGRHEDTGRTPLPQGTRS